MADTLHPRNRHRGGLDFPLLIKACPELAAFVFVNEFKTTTMDFADPVAVKWLNTALLKHHYGVSSWDIPAGYLCPSIPGRADYLHNVADLLAASLGGALPKRVHALDIGVGASCVYPLIGHAEYGWTFVGTDIDPLALSNATGIVKANKLGHAIEIRSHKFLSGALKDGERFEVMICNPPFHASASEAEEGARRKWRNLGKRSPGPRPKLNFGGRGHELWSPGGEAAFVQQLVAESVGVGERVLWFTSLVSKSANLPAVQRALKRARALETRTIEMKQGQKVSRFVAWTFHDAKARAAWLA